MICDLKNEIVQLNTHIDLLVKENKQHKIQFEQFASFIENRFTNSTSSQKQE
eukprot:TRINITY_DN295_c0_g1_i1.p3 TRINITY_DN295_c0_g1~~TRINITY_DN295_c0_g1_i1.p3  ORF type:complete len:52 (+),score=17.09 TRINITY_DN295_c0_g1_i1:722-877(+)